MVYELGLVSFTVFVYLTLGMSTVMALFIAGTAVWRIKKHYNTKQREQIEQSAQ